MTAKLTPEIMDEQDAHARGRIAHAERVCGLLAADAIGYDDDLNLRRDEASLAMRARFVGTMMAPDEDGREVSPRTAVRVLGISTAAVHNALARFHSDGRAT